MLLVVFEVTIFTNEKKTYASVSEKTFSFFSGIFSSITAILKKALDTIFVFVTNNH